MKKVSTLSNLALKALKIVPAFRTERLLTKTLLDRCYTESFMGASTLKRSSYKHPNGTVDARYLEHLLSRTFWPVP